jgi:hypothetical protein
MAYTSEADWAGHNLLRLADMEGVIAPAARAVAAGLEASIIRRRMPGTHGWCVYGARDLIVPRGVEEQVFCNSLMHECSHLGGRDLKCEGYANDDFTNDLKIRVQVPDHGIRALVRELGFDPKRLAKHYPEVPTTIVLRRAVQATRHFVVVFHFPGGVRWLECPVGREDIRLPISSDEANMVLEVHKSGKPVRDFDSGAIGYPVQDPGGVRGVAIVFDLRGRSMRLLG